MAAYGDNRVLLEDHSNRYLCVLYFMSRGIMSRAIDSDRVFSELGMEAFIDRQQARAEIVQYLQLLERIEYDNSNNTVRLSRQGLVWSEQQCRNPVFQIYRHLQTRSS